MSVIEGDNQNICFNEKLLAGTDRESLEYQTGVLKLLEKEKIDNPQDPSNACVPQYCWLFI